jgi:putative hemolysin
MDFLLIALLTALNGLFAMSEMALATSRKARLAALAEAGDKGAEVALKVLDNPTTFLSTVQVGITSIGVLNGIVGEAAFSDDLAQMMRGWGVGDKVAGVSATAVVVTLITFVTILFGELVPKRIGQLYPEMIARWVAVPMRWMALLSAPFVHLLSFSTHAMLRLLRIDTDRSQAVTEEEIAASLAEGVDAGVIEAHEHQMVRNVFHLDERPLTSLMTPREDIVYFDVTDCLEDCVRKAGLFSAGGGEASTRAGHSWYPVCKGHLDEVVGMVSTARLLSRLLAPDGRVAVAADLAEPVGFVPETLSGLELLEQFRLKATRVVLVVDEYGVVQGLLTAKDLLEAITGELKPQSQGQAWAVHEPDGSWQLDGMMPIPEFKARLGIKDLPDEEKDRYNTLGGLLMSVTGHLPALGEKIDIDDWVFEVARLHGRRIDHVVGRQRQ